MVYKDNAIIKLVDAAKLSADAADELIIKYLPFIKSETSKSIGKPVNDNDDELSIAMLAFYEAIMNYKSDKGAFLPLAARTIKNRLVDYYRKEKRHTNVVSIHTPITSDERTIMDTMADPKDEFERVNTRAATSNEIAEYAAQLNEFGISLSDVADNCPKQERTLAACMKVLDYARQHPYILNELINTKKLPISKLSEEARVERKTLERHRKYLVAILIAYTNGFEIIRGHLSSIKRREGAQL